MRVPAVSYVVLVIGSLTLPASASSMVVQSSTDGPGIPAGTRVLVQTAVQVDTRMSVGQSIAVRLAEDIVLDDGEGVGAGARGLAEVIEVIGADGEADSEMRIAFQLTSLRVDGRSIPFQTGPAGLSVTDGSVRQTGPGEVVRGSRGGIELRDDGQRLVIRSGTRVVFQLSEPARLPVP